MIADFFRDYGLINDAWVARKPPGFGFVFFDSDRDAVGNFDCFDQDFFSVTKISALISTSCPVDDRPTIQRDAVRDLSGKDLRGNRVRIELSKPR